MLHPVMYIFHDINLKVCFQHSVLSVIVIIHFTENTLYYLYELIILIVIFFCLVVHRMLGDKKHMKVNI